MAKKESKKKTLTIVEAVDNLSSMAELEPGQIEIEAEGIDWLDLKDEQETISRVKTTFKTIKNYMEDVCSKEEDLKDIETQKGLKAIMLLAGEAAERLDRYTKVFKHVKIKVTDLEEFKDLKEFYLSKIMRRFQKALETEEEWLEEWGTGEEDVLDIMRRGLKDLEVVKHDRDYELFYIRKEDEKPFFNRNVLRHIKLVTDFDEIISEIEEDDPLLRIEPAQDKDAHFSALEMKENVLPYLNEFYAQALKYKQDELPKLLSKASMALLLAANPRNLIQNNTGKCCLHYFIDFHAFIREALNSSDYLHLVSLQSLEESSFNQIMVELLGRFCYVFFLRVGDRKDCLALIHRMIEGGRGKKKPHHSTSSPLYIWNTLLEDHEHLDNLLSHYPNGPLMKTMDLFNQREDVKGFDPIGQNNIPSFRFSFSYGKLDCKCIHLPSPTSQEIINKAKVIEEYKALLRHLQMQSERPYLLINLQDRTSWKEHARCIALEKLQREAEFSKNLIVITLPKNTDFYFQTDAYLEVNEAGAFIKILNDQVESGESCGFYFPEAIRRNLKPFVEKSIDLIHQFFFAGNKILSRKNRLDFIEIFYQVLLLRIINETKPTLLSFTCKDGIDTGAAASSLFFGFVKLFSSDLTFIDADQEYLQWALFAPALFIRERSVDITRLSRMVSAISVVHAELESNPKKITKSMEALFGYPIFQEMQIEL